MRTSAQLLALLFAAALCAPAAQAQAGGGVVTRSDLRLRSSPSSSSRAVSSVPRGYPVIMGACTRGWCEVGYMGVRGYAPENQLMRSSGPSNPPRVGRSSTAGTSAAPAASQRTRVVMPEPSGPVRPLCKGKYDEAEATFAIGAYPETIDLISVCASDATFTSTETASAYRMLALSHFYRGEHREARQALIQMFERDPAYEPSYALDPPDYITLVRNLKLELQLISSADYQCDERVAESQELYTAANYSGVLNLLYGCLNEPDLAESVASRTHRLAALSHMKRGDEDAAHETIKALLDVVPEYRADAVQDVPAYVALVDEVRKANGPRRSPWGW